VVDEKTQEPIRDVTIYCKGKEIIYKGLTDEAGSAKIKIFEPTLQQIIASPRDKYWSKVISFPNVAENPQVNFALRELTVEGAYGWGHLEMVIDKINQKFTGRGIKVAVIDSGIAKHEDLVTIGGYNTLDGQDTKDWHVDEKGHGTHVCGIISAQLKPNRGFWSCPRGRNLLPEGLSRGQI
jgi:subtilisin